MMQQVLEVQGGYWQLDSPPRTITSQVHRPAYGTDGDYFSKPSADDVFAAVYEMMPDPDQPGRKKLFIHHENCVHCKTCDIADPYQVITWTPPQGGEGPDYTQM